MIAIQHDDFRHIFRMLQMSLLEQDPIDVGEWQSQKLDPNPLTQMRELASVTIEWSLPQAQHLLAAATGAHLPWAEDHFQERVGGEPINPPPSNEWWPFAQKNNAAHKSEGEGQKFSHTYPERMWPKWAGVPLVDLAENDPLRDVELGHIDPPNAGIRYTYGDLNDVVDLLRRQPNTRQAYLPIWFPEDTGVVQGMRVPCTLGYHFMIRNGVLSISYYMRSCDLVRHFQDDVYMAGRLAQWVVDQLNFHKGDDGHTRARKVKYTVGNLYMSIANLHVFNGDTAMMTYRNNRGQAWTE